MQLGNLGRGRLVRGNAGARLLGDVLRQSVRAEDQGLAFGACRLPDDAGLIFKVLARETRQVKAKVREFWEIVREEITGTTLSAPFFWR